MFVKERLFPVKGIEVVEVMGLVKELKLGREILNIPAVVIF
jgi:hypothetical protein